MVKKYFGCSSYTSRTQLKSLKIPISFPIFHSPYFPFPIYPLVPSFIPLSLHFYSTPLPLFSHQPTPILFPNPPSLFPIYPLYPLSHPLPVSPIKPLKNTPKSLSEPFNLTPNSPYSSFSLSYITFIIFHIIPYFFTILSL